MAQQIKDCLIHWKKKLERGVDEEKALDIMRKLYKVPITVEYLQDTGIGKTIKQLGKKNGKLGEKATIVYKKWKRVVSSSSSAHDKLPQSSSKHSIHISSNKQSSSSIVKEQDKLLNGNNIQKTDKAHVNESQKTKYSNGHTKHSSSKSLKSSDIVSSKTHIASEHESHSSNGEECSEYIPDNITDSSGEYAYNPERPEIIVPSIKSSLNNIEYKPTPINVIHNPKSAHKKEEKRNVLVTVSFKPSVKKHEKVLSESIKHKVKLNDSSNQKSSKSKHLDENESDEKLKNKSSGLTNKKNIEDKGSNKFEKTKASKRTSESIKTELKSVKKLKVSDSEAFTASEVSFEACLGFNDIVTSKKKKSSNLKTSSKNGSSQVTKNKVKSSEKHKSSGERVQSSKGTKLSSGEKVHSSKGTKLSSGEKVHSSKGTKLSSGEKVHASKGTKSSTKDEKKFSTEEIISKDLKVPLPSSTFKPIDILSTLPEIQPNYKPLPRFDFEFCGSPKKKILSNEEAILFTSSKKDRTAVYSGRRHNYLSEVPTLFDACTRVLIENIDYLEYFGGVPYYILKPILERCTPQQLYQLEDFNPYLLEDTDELWERHCHKDFRKEMRNENENWRDLYLRVFDEKEKKLKALTANISASMSKSNPVRQVKLAYVDSVVKPPRDIARKQARHGTGLPVNHTVKPGPPSKATPRPLAPAINAAATAKAIVVPAAPKKPKVAPLMAKTLKAMKKAYRR